MNPTEEQIKVSCEEPSKTQKESLQGLKNFSENAVGPLGMAQRRWIPT